MTERLVEERFAVGPARLLDRRLDVLRQRANWLAEKIDRSPVGSRSRDEREHAAIMWALAELSGVSDDVRRERAERVEVKAGAARRATKRAEAAEALNIQYRVKVDALKAEIWRLRNERDSQAALLARDYLPSELCPQCGVVKPCHVHQATERS